MADASFQGTALVAGLGMNLTIARTGDLATAHDPTVPFGFVGTLSTRTDAVDGIVTVASHDLLDTDWVTIYWEGGLAYRCDITAKDATTITFEGEGDNSDVLPTQGTTVIISKEVEVDTDWDGDNLAFIAAVCPVRAHIVFMEAGETEQDDQEILAGQCWWWASDLGMTNNLTGNAIDKVYVSCADTSTDQTFLLGLLLDSTP